MRQLRGNARLICGILRYTDPVKSATPVHKSNQTMEHIQVQVHFFVFPEQRSINPNLMTFFFVASNKFLLQQLLHITLACPRRLPTPLPHIYKKQKAY